MTLKCWHMLNDLHIFISLLHSRFLRKYVGTKYICLEYNSCHERSRLRSRHFSCCTLHFQVGIDGKSLRLNYVRYTASLKLKNGPHYATIVPLRKSMRTMEENAVWFSYERFYFYKNKTNAIFICYKQQ